MAGTAVWWIRRDVRLHDNPALTAAAARAGTVVPVCVLGPGVLEGRLHRSAARRRAFLFRGLAELDDALRTRGPRLVVRSGRPADVLRAVLDETGASVVVAERDVSP